MALSDYPQELVEQARQTCLELSADPVDDETLERICRMTTEMLQTSAEIAANGVTFDPEVVERLRREVERDQDFIMSPDLKPGEMVLHAAGKEVIRINDDGKIFVNGRLAATDHDVVQGIRAFLMQTGYSSSAWKDLESYGVPKTRYDRLDD